MTVIRKIEALLGIVSRDPVKSIVCRPIPNNQPKVSEGTMKPITEEENILTRVSRAAGEDWELRLRQP